MVTIFVLTGSIELPGHNDSPANRDFVVEHHIKLTIKWKDKNAGEKILDAKVKLSLLTSNADLPQPWSPEFVSLSTLTGDIANADAKLLSRTNNEPNSALNLKIAIKLLYDDITNIGKLVQIKMDAKISEAIRICTNAGFTYKTLKVRGKRKNAATPTNEPGVMKVEVEGSRSHQWQMSPDGGTTVIDLSPTTCGKTKAVNLISDKKYWFRSRKVLSKGRYGEWTDWFWGFAP